MTKLDEFHVKQHYEAFGGEFVVCRPVLAVAFFMARSTSQIGSAVADAIELFVDHIPANSLKSAKKANGEDGPLTERGLQRDLKKLRSPDVTLMELRYHSGTPGNVGPYGLVLDSNLLKSHLPTFTNLLRFELPPEAVDDSSRERSLALIRQLVDTVPFQSGFAGYALGYLGAFAGPVNERLPGFLMRFIGLDPSYTRSYRFMRGATPDAHWLMFLSAELLETLGGRPALENAVASAKIESSSKGVIVQSAAVPPIGDVNRGARDIGVLPDLARFLKSSRVQIPHMFNDDFDPERWLSRFDERNSCDWDNRA